MGAHAGSPIHRGGQERGGQLLERLSSGARVCVGPGSEGREQLIDNVASYGRSFCHMPQLPAPGVLFAAE